MDIWYDVTGLTGWTEPFLTGIQRTTVGLLDGLLAHGVGVRLTAFDVRQRRFVAVGRDALPAVARGLPEGSAAVPDAAAAQATHDRATHARRRRVRDALFGTTPAARELRGAFRTWRRASSDLAAGGRRWLRTRLSNRGPASATNPAAPVAIGNGPFAPGDTLLSMGCTWATAGHAEAVARGRARGVHVVRMIYDLIPAIKPQWVIPALCSDFVHWARGVLTESDHVLTISEFSRREILRYCDECGFAVPPITVVRLGDVIDAAEGGEPPPLPRFVPTRPFFVCVSTLDVRKNHRLLYQAWSRMAEADPDACPDLVCIGSMNLLVADLLHEMRHDRMVNGRIHLLSDVPDSELAWYYAACTATIYPSRYEGWGLPVAESLGRGKLCLASNATSIPEIDGDLPVFFDPHDPGALAGLVRRALDEPAWVRDRER
ncbi:MAG: glycosyltransferase family 4 protein, partial [Planctomycetia bacterium]